MNPLAQQALGAIIRWALTFLAGFIVQRGIWSQAEASTYIMAASLGLLALGWSIWNKYKGRIRLLTALASPAGTSEAAVADKISSGLGAKLSVVLLACALGAGAVPSTSCATAAGSRPPDVAAAQVGTDVLKAATLLQNEVNRLTAATVMPVPVGQSITNANTRVSAKAGQLSTALKAYHAATALADRSAKAAEVQALITDLSGPLADMLGVKLPAGAAQSVTRLIGAVMQAVGAIQAEIAKGLSGAVWRQPLAVRA